MDSVFVSDKRKHPRFQVSIPVGSIRYNDRDITSHTFDISSDGIGLVMDSELPLGQTIDMSLHMPDNGESISFHGKAVWMIVAGPNRYRAGIVVEPEHIKPIPLVLRTIRLRTHSFG
ncbi:MAG TPA: PilZ domain-containing protein [Candidatus Omnitrophota bacterium]|nr:PilZ domain-containing protein [Candidatus Omnitrophota bacterium]HQO37900.1 PilZ domain-containing protein [Candidatus Omnitrophota bacterium]HQQ06324.1 PilZ domain-containing protein [Candidatus Omnitrophota bacterium]